MLLITDTYVSFKPFVREAIRNNNENPVSGKANMMKGASSGRQEKVTYPGLGLAVGNRVSLESPTLCWSPINLICFRSDKALTQQWLSLFPLWSSGPTDSMCCCGTKGIIKKKAQHETSHLISSCGTQKNLLFVKVVEQTWFGKGSGGEGGKASWVVVEGRTVFWTQRGREPVACIMWAVAKTPKQIGGDQSPSLLSQPSGYWPSHHENPSILNSMALIRESEELSLVPAAVIPWSPLWWARELSNRHVLPGQMHSDMSGDQQDSSSGQDSSSVWNCFLSQVEFMDKVYEIYKLFKVVKLRSFIFYIQLRSKISLPFSL